MIFVNFIIVGLIACVILERVNYKEEGVSGVILASFLGALIGFFIAFIVSAIGTVISGPTEFASKNTYDIVSLKDTGSGSKYLFGSAYNDKLIYRYMVATDEGYETRQVDAKQTLVIYDDNPRVEEGYKVYSNPIHRYFSLPYSCTKFYVPEGTIEQDYSIDLE